MIRNCILLVCCLCSLLSCSTEPKEGLKQFVEAAKTQAPKPIAPLPELPTIKIVVYEAQQLRSPFEPAIISQLDKPVLDWSQSEVKAVLEHYPIDALRMVGTFAKGNQIWALIRDGSGWIHPVQIHDRIGQHGGEVISITENRVEISEWIMDNAGGWRERKVPINLI